MEQVGLLVVTSFVWGFCALGYVAGGWWIAKQFRTDGPRWYWGPLLLILIVWAGAPFFWFVEYTFGLEFAEFRRSALRITGSLIAIYSLWAAVSFDRIAEYLQEARGDRFRFVRRTLLRAIVLFGGAIAVAICFGAVKGMLSSLGYARYEGNDKFEALLRKQLSSQESPYVVEVESCAKLNALLHRVPNQTLRIHSPWFFGDGDVEMPSDKVFAKQGRFTYWHSSASGEVPFNRQFVTWEPTVGATCHLSLGVTLAGSISSVSVAQLIAAAAEKIRSASDEQRSVHENPEAFMLFALTSVLEYFHSKSLTLEPANKHAVDVDHVLERLEPVLTLFVFSVLIAMSEEGVTAPPAGPPLPPKPSRGARRRRKGPHRDPVTQEWSAGSD